MDQRYVDWIETHYPTVSTAFGACSAATTQMVAAFPELTRVPGHVQSYQSGRRAHWWCETSEGEIVDPTRIQFEDAVFLSYERFQPGQEVRVGRCMNCGEPIFAVMEELGKVPDSLYSTSFCDKICYAEMAEAVGWDD